jgi:hypothetical protein
VPKRRKTRHPQFKVYRGRESPTIPAGELLLEYFTDEEALGWRAKSEDVQNYHYLWWFELEGQRAALHSRSWSNSPIVRVPGSKTSRSSMSSDIRSDLKSRVSA